MDLSKYINRAWCKEVRYLHISILSTAAAHFGGDQMGFCFVFIILLDARTTVPLRNQPNSVYSTGQIHTLQESVTEKIYICAGVEGQS